MDTRLRWIAMPLLLAAGAVAAQLPQWPSLPAPPPPPALPAVKLPSVPPPPAPPPLPTLPVVNCAGGCAVEKNTRALVLVNYVSDTDKYKPMYRFFENKGRDVTRSWLQREYTEIAELRQTNANGMDSTHPYEPTSLSLRDTIWRLARDARIQAIDVIIILHGFPGGLQFEDRKEALTKTGGLAPQLLRNCTTTPAHQAESCRQENERIRAKLRLLLSTACYGKTHFDGWLAAGFDVATGSSGVYADSIASYPAMLEAWAKGYSVAEVIDRGNRADPYRSYDRWAKEVLGFSDVDSTRRVTGDGSLRISSLPR